MPPGLRTVFGTICLLCVGVAQGQTAKVIQLAGPIANAIHESALGGRHFYVKGVADTDIRIDVQISYYTEEPDFETCGGRSYGWPKPVALMQQVVFRPPPGEYAVMLSDRYSNPDDPRASLCKWRMGGVTVRGYASDHRDLLAVVRFEEPHRALALRVYDPQPTPLAISLSCSRKPAPRDNWKPRCSYAPIGQPGTHFLLSAEHSSLVRKGSDVYEVESPIEVNFRFHD